MKTDWDAGHGPVFGPFNAATATLATAWAGHVAHVSPMWAAAAAGTGLIGHHIAGVRHRVTGTSLAMRAATWAGAGAWCSWAMATGPWTRDALGALVAGTLGLGLAWVGETRHARHAQEAQRHAGEAQAQQELAAARGKLAEEWQQRIARVTHVEGLRIVAIEQWPTGAGFSIEAELPQGGTTWRQIAGFGDNLAADARLPEGCGVQVGPGAHRGAVIIDVATVNHLIEDVYYPEDYSPLTINEPVPYGVYPDGTITALHLREASTLRVGQRGSGKTNEMNVGLANGVRMVDNLDWVIDLNGGGLALAWLHAWHKAGRPGRPPIDWVADTPEKALAMSEAFVDIAKARKPGYKHLEIEANDDKLPLSPQVPGIRIRCDEIAELFSPKALRDPVLKQVAANLVQGMEIARAVGLNEDLAGLRATQDVISEPQLLKQSYIRMGLRVTDSNELAYLFGWEDKAKPEDAPYPGSGLLKVGSAPARPFKVYRIRPAQIAEVVTACAEHQPELDELSRRAAGEAYEQRWDGTDHLFGLAPVPAPRVQDEPPAPVRRRATADWDTAPATSSTQDALEAADRLRDQVRNASNEAASHDTDLERQFREVLENGGGVWKPAITPEPRTGMEPAELQPTPGVSDDARWPLVFRLVVKAGPAGIGPDAARDEFKDAFPTMQVPSRSAITDWCKNEPQIFKPMHGAYAHVMYRTDTPGEQP